MTEHDQHDETPRAAEGAGAPTTPQSADQPTERITTGPHVEDAVAPAHPDRPTQPLPFTPPAGDDTAPQPQHHAAPHAEHPGFRSPEHPTQALPLAAPAAHGAPTPAGLGSPPQQQAGTPTPAWLGGTPQQPAASPTPDPLAGWEEHPAPVATRTRRGRWTPLVGTAAAAALLASVATAGLTGAFGADGATSSPTASSVATIGQTSTDTVPVAGSTADDPDWERVAASVAASVVAIQVSTASGGGEGSGVIIDDAGHILTNNHVVSGAENDTVQVTLNDGRLYEATVIGTDPSTDLAIVQIDDAPDDLSPAALGDSDGVTVGAPVMAVGNPLGLANTVTTGIVSAVDRPVSASSAEATSTSDVVVTNAIQIDAAINPGNSGGPLFDAQGRVVGITSSIATLSSGGSQTGSIGLGFAIPVNLAKSVGQQLIEDGTAEHAFLGVSLTDGTATADDVSRRGAVVQEVTDGSPAAAADLQAGDAIVAIDGDAVGGSESLTAYVRERTAGDTAKLTVVRDGESLEVTVTLAARETAVPADEPSGSSDDGSDRGVLPGFPGSGIDPSDPFGNQG
ncbi:serine protease [Cellulomonas aerilata]|uniref:Serine protease n=2 Tax=Cellulomonas aerilata TaxID=515326 RepID=A0A512D8J1_9CELL|nr:serine protease [Cellulomonas aerilata]